MNMNMQAPTATVQVFRDKDAILHPLAEIIVSVAASAISERGSFTVALSGGSLPKLLSGLVDRADISWDLWHVFFADERCVPLDHADSNYMACNSDLFQHIALPRENIYTIESVDNPLQAAALYESAINSVLGGVLPSFDLVLLGMGPDGHTASLFPGHSLLSYTGSIVAPITDSPKPPPQRITLTLQTINNAQNIMFVVTGEQKASVVGKILQLPPTAHFDVSQPLQLNSTATIDSTELLPAALVIGGPQTKTLTWVLDAEAAAGIASPTCLP